MVGVVIIWDGKTIAHRIIRDDVLDGLYGKSAQGARTLIDRGLETLRQIVSGSAIEGELPSTFGMHPGPLRHTHAETLGEALRTAALLYSSLANLDRLDNLEEEDAPTQEETNRRFTTEVRNRVIERRPDLQQYFGRQAVLTQGGEPIKFGFCSHRAILHFGVLSPVRQSSGVRDARARLWELHRARLWAELPIAALVFAAPRADDPTLSKQQLESVKRNLIEIEREADSFDMHFDPVTSIDDGVERVISYA